MQDIFALRPDVVIEAEKDLLFWIPSGSGSIQIMQPLMLKHLMFTKCLLMQELTTVRV